MDSIIHNNASNADLFRPVCGIVPQHLFEQESPLQKIVGLQDEQAEMLGHGRALRCAACKTVITYEGHAEHIQGQHVHSFVNPGGYEFTIGCFRRAWCRLMGLATLEWSWFTGYTWQYAFCPQCREHLGWFYHGAVDDSSFYGLILNRLIIDNSGSQQA